MIKHLYFRLSHGVSFAFLTIVLTLSQAWAFTPGQELQKRLNSIYSMQANFTQLTLSGQSSKVSHGTMSVMKPGRFRWDLKSPSLKQIVSNGRDVYMYDEDLAQVTIVPARKAIDRVPAMLLSGRIRLLTNYFIVTYVRGWYYLRPRYPSNMLKMIQLKFQGKKLQQMRLFDNFGRRSILRFKQVRVNIKLNPALFHFKMPEDVAGDIDVIRQH